MALPTRKAPNLLVVAGKGAARPTSLAAFGQAITSRFTPEQAQITIVDPKTSADRGDSRRPMCVHTPIPRTTSTRCSPGWPRCMRDRFPPSGLSQEELMNRGDVGGSAPFRADRRRAGIAAHGAIGKNAATAPLWDAQRSREIDCT